MRVVARSAFRRLGDAAPEAAQSSDSSDQLNVRLQPSAAVAGLGLWVAAGVLTHIAVRMIDRWFFHEK